jgi:HK97 gp10 family phage protein
MSAYRKAGKHVVNAARRNARSVSKTLAKSIGIMQGRDKSKPTIFIGPRSKSNQYRGLVKVRSVKHDGWFAHFYEFGTSVRKPRRKQYLTFKVNDNWVKARQAKGIRRQPFMRPAIDQNKRKVLEGFKDELAKAIDKEIQKHAKKYKWS